MDNIAKMKAITVACRIIAAAVLIGLAVWVLTSGTFFGWQGASFGFNMGGARNVPSSQSISAQGVRAINIDWVAGRIDVRPWEGSEIQITEYSARELRSGEALRLSAQDGIVSIDFRESRGPIVGNVAPKDLVVLIPHQVSDNLDSFTVNGMSSNIAVSGISATTFSAEAISGRVELTGINSERLNAGTTSGRVELFDVTAVRIDLRTISGRIETTQTRANDLDANTISGRQEISGDFAGRVNLDSVSGRIYLTSTTVPADLRAHAVSGRIAVTVPNDGEVINVQHSSASGRFNSEIPVMMHGGDPQFRLSTTSGRVEIFALR